MSNFGFNGRNIPFGFMGKKSGGGGLVDGSDGDLVVLNGQTVQIIAGSIKSYNSIDIQAGGVLEVVGSAITQIGCRNTFICNGTLRGKTSLGAIATGLVSLGADNWLGLSFSHTQNQAAGGQGGFANYDSPAYVTNPPQSQGNGGGGNGMTNWGSGSFPPICGPIMYGGNGSSNGTSHNRWFDNDDSTCYVETLTAFGGTGNLGGHGQAPAGGGSDAGQTRPAAFSLAAGGNGGGGGGGAGFVDQFKEAHTGHVGGAGGGGRGEHGANIFILAELGISGSGTIDCAGNVGYNGGPAHSGPANSGGGGGGGAGGAGGAVWIRHFGTSTVTPTILAGGGGGGIASPVSNGGAGYWNTGNAAFNPTNGSSGESGIIDVQSI